VRIRPYTPDDAPAAAEIFGEAMPEKPPPTAEGTAHFIASHPERAQLRLWIAEEDGQAVGLGVARFNWSVEPADTAWTWAGVRGAHRGRGLGAALFERAEEHALSIGARLLDSFALEGSAGQRFAESRGFEATRRQHILRLDPSRTDLAAIAELEAEQRAAGFRVVPLREVVADVRGLYEVYGPASADIPADRPEAGVTLEDFESHVLGDPELSLDGSAVVLEDESPVAFSFLLVDEESGAATNEMTGTLAKRRGRGLASLAKLAVVRWAREQGIAEVTTQNDDANVPMLALNRRLGYEVTATRVDLVRDPAAGRA
jgi:GNAT superfamily N-acetyltransferase